MQSDIPDTDLLFLRDAYLKATTATVVATDGQAVALDRTVFYPTGGGQPHDTGTIGSSEVTNVVKKGGVVWHHLASDTPPIGATVDATINWERRHELMRTHTAMHLLCGVIWNQYGKSVTGGNMQPLSGRMDFEFDPLPENFAQSITEAVNREIEADRPIAVSFVDRTAAVQDADLIRTKVNLIPESVTEIRVVDIVGLDKQADGGTHVARTSEVGRFDVVKTESKGKGNKRVRIQLK